MARVCDICGKGGRTGNIITRRGLPKAKGGIGLHTTGITRRRFLPNLQKIRVMENGGITICKVCAACIKSGKVAKAGKRVERKPDDSRQTTDAGLKKTPDDPALPEQTPDKKL